MALNAQTFANDMLTAYENAGKLTGLDTNAKNKILSDWEFQFDLLFEHFKNNAVIKTTVDSGNDANTRFNTIMTTGIPIALDGGVGLKTTTLVTSAIPSTETQTGGIE